MAHDHHTHTQFVPEGDMEGKVERALRLAFYLNFLFLIIEVVAGLLTNSLVLLSDAGHMISDVAALGLALLMQRLAHVKASGSYTFGLRRAPVLGAFGNALTLYLIVIIIFWEAWQRIKHPPEINGLPVLLVGIAGLLINVVSAYWLFADREEDLNVKGAFLHLAADALGSLGAIVAALVMMTTGWTLIDPLISLGLAALIAFGTWPLLRDSINVLLQAAPRKIDLAQLRERFTAEPLIENIFDFHVWEMNSSDLIFTITVTAAAKDCELVKIQEVNDRLKKVLNDEFGIAHATIEWRTPDSKGNGCEEIETFYA